MHSSLPYAAAFDVGCTRVHSSPEGIRSRSTRNLSRVPLREELHIWSTTFLTHGPLKLEATQEYGQDFPIVQTYSGNYQPIWVLIVSCSHASLPIVFRMK